MTETRRKRVIYAVFIIAVLWGLYNQPWKGRERKTAPPVPQKPAVAAVVTTGAATTEKAVVRPATSEWTIDPFRSSRRQESADEGGGVKNNGSASEPVLQGTMTVRGTEVCVLDGQVCATGDRHGLWQITKIEQGVVTLVGPNQECLTLRPRRTGE